MKLRGLKNRAYNILFHTHTVAGIVISFGLFIIFYAGSFSMFRHEMIRWENPAARFEAPTTVDFDQVMAAIQKEMPAFAEAEQFSIRLPNDQIPFLQFFGAEDTAEGQPKRFQALVNTTNDYEVTNLEDPKTTVSETLYHLHYFDQLPGGLYLSGLVALFFLFATITGLLIHWRNIITKFYAFTVGGKWKQIWTNAHTVLGVIGLPFQVIYAITGALFGLLILLLLPSALVLFNGDTAAVLATVRPEGALVVEKDSPIVEHASIGTYYKQVRNSYPDVPVSVITTRNHGRADGLVSFYLDDEKSLLGSGQVTFALNSGEKLIEAAPGSKKYTQSVLDLITKLHFGTFGGILLKIVYFILGMITCFMILSGVLLWQQARNNQRYTLKQKQFHHRITKAYLAICLSMFPAVALLFLANKTISMELIQRTSYVNSIFFLGWLCFILLGLRWNNYRQLNKNYLFIGGILALLIPISNGIVTNDWLWKTLSAGHWYVASVDLFWLITGLSALVIVSLTPNTNKSLDNDNITRQHSQTTVADEIMTVQLKTNTTSN